MKKYVLFLIVLFTLFMVPNSAAATFDWDYTCQNSDGADVTMSQYSGTYNFGDSLSRDSAGNNCRIESWDNNLIDGEVYVRVLMVGPDSTVHHEVKGAMPAGVYTVDNGAKFGAGHSFTIPETDNNDNSMGTGNYDIKLRIMIADTDSSDNSKWVLSDSIGTITVTDQSSPDADFSYSPDGTDEIGVGSEIYLDASDSTDSDGSITSYSWSGSGVTFAPDTGEKVRAFADQTGSHQITLTVEDDAGLTDTYSRTIDVVDSNHYEDVAAGKYLYIERDKVNQDDKTNREHFYWGLSNEKWSSEPDLTYPGEMAIRERDRGDLTGLNQDERFIFNTVPGEIINEEPWHLDMMTTSSSPIATRGSNCGSGDTPCEIVSNDWTNRDQDRSSTKSTPNGISSSEFIHLGDNGGENHFLPYGQLAVGHTPNIKGDPDMNGEKRFFVCRQAGHPDSGATNGMVIDVSTDGDSTKRFDSEGNKVSEPNLYKCDSTSSTSDWRGEFSGIWRPVAACNDGLDNDQDGQVDESDGNCDGKSDNSESGPSDSGGSNTCLDPVVGIYKDTIPSGLVVERKAAFYDQDSSGSYINSQNGCRYNGMDQNIVKGEPDVFICDGGSAIENSATGDDDVTAEKDNYCRYNIQARQTTASNGFNNQFTCSAGNCLLGGYHNGSALAVQYYVPKEAIPLGTESVFYVNSTGFENYRFDHIHSAARDFIPCGEYSSYYECAELHNQTMYSRLGIDVGTAYSRAVNDTDEDAIRGMWKVSNATDQYAGDITRIRRNEPYLSSDSISVVNNTVFDGGFYPDCSSAQVWGRTGTRSSTNGWECTGALDWTLDAYAVDTTGSENKDRVGFFIMPWEFRDSAFGTLSSYREATGGSDMHTAASIDEIRTLCWRGKISETPAFDSGGEEDEWFGRKVTGISSNPQVPIPLFGNLELGSDDKQYSCRVEFDNSNGKTITQQGTLVLLSNNKTAEQRSKPEKILRGSYTPYDAISDSWFDPQAVCSGGSTCSPPPADLIPQKDELDGMELISSQVQYMDDMWSQNLSASVSDMGSGSASNYLKNGN